MSEQRLSALLSALVSRGKLTPDEAEQILDAFRAGDLPPEVWPEDTGALTAADFAPVLALAALLRALRLLRPNDARGAVRFLAAVLRPALPASAGGTAATAQAAARALPRAYGGLSALPPDIRRQLADGIQDAFAREANRRAALLKMTPEQAGAARRSAGDVRRFHVAMQQAIRQDALALAQLGAGGPLSAQDARRLAASIAEQERYLQRFVDEIAAREALEAAGGRAAMTEAQIAQRARMYSGNARAAFWEADAARQAPGIVAMYRAVDDPVTCGPCSSAAAGSPYLPGAHPLPGSQCLGKGACRCWIEWREDADAYARLTGRTQRIAA